MVPLELQAQASRGPMAFTPPRPSPVTVVGAVCRTQILPPSVVWRIMQSAPLGSPTAHATDAFTADTSLMSTSGTWAGEP